MAERKNKMKKKCYSELKCKNSLMMIPKTLLVTIILISMSGVFGLSQVHAGNWIEMDNLGGYGEIIVYDGKLLAGTYGNPVLLLDGNTWTEMDGSPKSVKSFAIYKGTLYAAASERVWKYDGNTWTEASDNTIYTGSLTVNNGLLYMHTTTVKPAFIYKYNGSDWETIPKGDFTFVNSITFDEDHHLYAGNLLGVWEYDGSNWILIDDSPYGSNIIYFNGTLYASEPNEKVWAYNKDTWTSLSKDTRNTHFYVFNETLYGVNSGGLFTLNDENVTFFNGAPTGLSSMAEYNGKLYVGDIHGNMYYFEPTSMTELNNAIDDAKQKLVEHSEGMGVGQVPKGASDTLKDAIDTAQSVADDGANKTQSEVDDATTILEDAISTFTNAVMKAGDPTALNDVLNHANEQLASHSVGSGVGEVPRKALETFKNEIAVVQSVFDDAANKSQTELDKAVRILNDAITIFKNSVHDKAEQSEENDDTNKTEQKDEYDTTNNDSKLNFEGEENTSPNENRELPKTSTNLHTWLLVGLLLVIIGGTLLFTRFRVRSS